MKHEPHIKRLKTHRNVLYGIVLILLILQVLFFVISSSQTTKIISDQERLKDQLDNSVDEIRQENQVSLNEITKIIADQKRNFNDEIALLKASEEDFSGIIENVLKGVVSVRTERSIGSGFLISPAGYVVTNAHVIQDASNVRISTFDGEEISASVVGIDVFTDLALLKVPGVFPFLELEYSDEIQTGEKVIAIGNPLGLSFTVTEGIVSAVNRQGPNGLEAYIQTDVTLNPGNSGGPLISKEGKVIGVNNFKIGGAESLGFALESDVVRDKVNEFVNQTIIE
jgi:S1-C subfamily serine protease